MALRAVDFSSVPGTVINYQPLTYKITSAAAQIFISDPEILVLPNGTYLASHALAGSSSGSGTSGKTTLFRSIDKGATWTTVRTFNELLRASLFAFNNAVYLLGSTKDASGKFTILKSADNGSTWSVATQTTLGGTATPNNPVISGNRLWCAAGTTVISASIGSDLLLAASWKTTGGFPAYQPGWPSEGEFIGEGQIVASPEMGVSILAKVKQHVLTARARVNEITGKISFDPSDDFAALPGGEKKFGAAYDAGSGKFFVLSNPVLAAHANSAILPDMIRNTAVVLSSRDLRNWKMEKIFLYSADISHQGFGYLNFDFDGSNMVVAARTAWVIPGERAPNDGRAHDSNLLTFHQIDDFRNLVPDHYLKISGNQILRYERTPDSQDDDAPLGSFTLGSIFAGAALASPDGMGMTPAGDVYIREAGGRILQFDVLGNFIATNSVAPVAFQSTPINVLQPAAGDCSWASSGSGEWSNLQNWYYWGRPDTTEEVAVFGSAITAPATINIPATESYQLKGLRFRSVHPYTLSGGGQLRIEANSGNATMDLLQGRHTNDVALILGSDIDVNLADNTSLYLKQGIDLNNRTLHINGTGRLLLQGALEMGGGTITVNGHTPLTFAGDLTSTVLDGTLLFLPEESFVPSDDTLFTLLDNPTLLGERRFNQVSLPALPEGLQWNTDSLYSAGIITIATTETLEWWLTQYGLTNFSADAMADLDGDGLLTWQEYIAGTDPTNSASCFRISSVDITQQGAAVVRWLSVSDRSYNLYWSTNLLESFTLLAGASNLPATPPENVFTNSPPQNSTPSFYRLGVQK